MMLRGFNIGCIKSQLDTFRKAGNLKLLKALRQPLHAMYKGLKAHD
jgi:hypothetical protein